MSWNKAVTRQYTDLLGRTPTATELSAAVGQVSGGAKTVGQIDDGQAILMGDWEVSNLLILAGAAALLLATALLRFSRRDIGS